MMMVNATELLFVLLQEAVLLLWGLRGVVKSSAAARHFSKIKYDANIPCIGLSREVLNFLEP